MNKRMGRKFRIVSTAKKVLCDIFKYNFMRTIIYLFFIIVSVLNGYIALGFIKLITDTASSVYNSEYINFRKLQYSAGSLLLLSFITYILTQYKDMYKISFDNSINEIINTQFKKKLSTIDYEYYESSETHEKIHRVNDRLTNGYNMIIESTVRIIEIFFYIIVYVVFLSGINIIFALLIVLASSFSGIIAAKMSKDKYQLLVDITNLNQKRDYLNSIPRDKVTHQEYQSGRLFSAISQRFSEAYKEAEKGYLKIHFFTILAESRSLLVFIMAIFVAYIFMSWQIILGIVNIGILLSMMIVFDNLHGKTASLSYYISNHAEDMLVIDEYFEIMGYQDVAVKLPCHTKSSNILFRDVSYNYPQSSRRALNNLNLEISTGEKIAIVGENGSGKTTFSNILLGLLSNFDGEVKIGDVVYTRENPIPITFVKCLNQDFKIYQMSIKDNLFIGNEEAKQKISDDELSDLLRDIGLNNFVNNLQGRIETNVGQLEESGIELSKGQEQRLAIGRVLVNNTTSIWIFDEPTAYLDPLGEVEIYDILYNLSLDKTLIFISHRLGFAKKANRILVFDEGHIIENGSHEELLKLGGKYATIFNTQKEWYE
ncbi:MAG: ATP-binding cassette domain-containing protein [Bacteroidales bacterium]|jgi:ATP-binding cassette subfamily B protein|nr:ATP-binding cassette domain-containing protein [Bacteroidales bacterium]